MAGEFGRLLLSTLSFSVLVVGVLGKSIPAVYIFGDSTADVGNNNFLPESRAKANFPPNGIDFVHGRATGRFSNGLNSADFLARKLGLARSPPPFLSLTNHTLPKHATIGVNFASAGSGILESTGSSLVQYLSMWKQLQHFAVVHTSVQDHIGAGATQEFLANSIFFVSTGSNDIFDYFAAHGPVSTNMKIVYIESLMTAYKYQLQRLYELGARKFGIISVSAIGCCPSLRSQNPSGGCVDDLNEFAQLFYQAINSMLIDLSHDLDGFKYSLGNSFEMVINFFKIAPSLGFTELTGACCGSGKLNGEGPCTPNATALCSHRNKYLFWDRFHPTHAASKVAADTLFGGSKEFVTPINFAQLAAAF